MQNAKCKGQNLNGEIWEWGDMGMREYGNEG